MQVTAFPWHELPLYRRAQCIQARSRRRLLANLFEPSALIEHAQALLVAEVQVRLLGQTPALLGAIDPCVWLSDHEQNVVIGVEPEAELVSVGLTRLLARPVRLTQPNLALDPVLGGAAAALVLEVARKAGRQAPFSVLTSRPEKLSREGSVLDFSVSLDGRIYRLKLWVSAERLEGAEGSPPPRQGYPQALLLAVPLVVGLATTPAHELEHLAAGDVWLPRSGLWVDGSPMGKGVLCAPNSSLGTPVDVSPGRVVLGKGRSRLENRTQAMSDDLPSDTTTDSLDQTLAEVPVVVRAEFGAVTLPAAEWAQLGPGDVVPLGQPLGGPVSLRAGGQVIAQGELVNVEGELGVRITQVLPLQGS